MTNESIDSIPPVARSFSWPAGPNGVVIIHGYGGTIADYRHFADYLHQRGLSTWGLRLTGHNKSLTELAASHITDWQRNVDAAVAEAKQNCSTVILVGASFGAALAIDYTVRQPDNIQGLMIVNLPVGYGRFCVQVRGLLKIIGLFKPNLSKFGLSTAERQLYHQTGSSLAWPISGLLATDHFIIKSAIPALKSVKCPVLVVMNNRDPYVDQHSEKIIIGRLKTSRYRLVKLPERGHRPFRSAVSTKLMAEQLINYFIETSALPINGKNVKVNKAA